jgi:HEAT repeat protein
MELYFCDRCNTSIPQRDVDAGVAILRAGRAYCAACKRIVTGEEAPRDVLFCDLCNVSISLADMREERAVFREGRLYCPKCKFLVIERTTTAANTVVAPSVPAPVAPAAPLPLVAAPPPAPASSRPRKSGSWAVWLLLIVVGMAAGVAMFRFAPDLRRLVDGDSSSVQTPALAANDSRGSHSTAPAASSVEVDLGGYLAKLDERFEGLRRDVEKQRADDRADWNNGLDELRSQSARVMQTEREQIEALRREIESVKTAVSALDVRRPEPPADSEESDVHDATPPPVEERPPAAPAPTAAPAPSPVERELERLKSPDAGVRFSAVVDLGRLADPNTVPAIGALAINDGDNYVRDFAVRVLGNFALPTAIPYLIRSLHDSDALVANSANDGLVRITKRTFGFDRKATAEQRQDAIRKWEEWWEKNRETFK